MTCIVGFVDKQKNVYLGGDSAGVRGLNIRVRKDPKVFKKGDMIIGYTSSFRMGQLLRFKLDIESQQWKMNDYHYMCTRFIDNVRHCLKVNGYSSIDNNEETIGEFIVGYRGNLYHIGSNLQVGMVEDCYDACGCGEYYALGSLATNKTGKPEERILKALEVAEKFSGGVRRPFRIVKLEKE